MRLSFVLLLTNDGLHYNIFIVDDIALLSHTRQHI